jgi:hypothetical protein
MFSVVSMVPTYRWSLSINCTTESGSGAFLHCEDNVKIKTSETTPIQIDWLVAKCEGLNVYIPAFASRPWLQIRGDHGFVGHCPKWSTNWSQGGTIIEREMIATSRGGSYEEHFWMASRGFSDERFYGPTPLIAAMRCYVASKLGDEVEVPEELT